MQLRKNQNFSPLTDHNSAATIHHSKRWDPEGKFLTGIWHIAVCAAACWVWAIRKEDAFYSGSNVFCILATSSVQNCWNQTGKTQLFFFFYYYHLCWCCCSDVQPWLTILLLLFHSKQKAVVTAEGQILFFNIYINIYIGNVAAIYTVYINLYVKSKWTTN